VRILVTNDDGVRATGLAVLAGALVEAGHDVVVAAPLAEASGAGAGVGPLHLMAGGLAVERVELDGRPGLEAVGVDALPALIVIAAFLGGFGEPPEAVVAGINPGRNVGRAVLHSGTVGAALTTAHFRARGLAVSIQAGRPSGARDDGAATTTRFETAAAVATRLLDLLERAPAGTVLNCNVPNLPLHALAGVRVARLARSGLIRSVVVDDAGPRLQLELGFRDPPPEDDTDEALTAAGFATVTPLAGVSESADPRVDELLRVGLAELLAPLDGTDTVASE
jgi:5'-nucleotidase